MNIDRLEKMVKQATIMQKDVIKLNDKEIGSKYYYLLLCLDNLITKEIERINE